MPCFKSSGNITKNAMEGKTSQKIPDDRALTFVTSLVSIYSHNIASIESNGMDANKAPIRELRLAVSEIVTIKNVVTAILTR